MLDGDKYYEEQYIVFVKERVKRDGVLGWVVPEGLSVESVQMTPWRERTPWAAHSLQRPWQVQRSWGGRELGMIEKCEEIIVAGET